MRQLLLAILSLIIISGCGDLKTTSQKNNKTVKEQHRPLIHFSPDSMWMNDPNGMVYHDGEYHLFYQYYPDSNVWGPMHWGHAVSNDMINWKHLPIALYPDSLGYIFSGSAIIDINNTSGLGSLENPAMVAIFTYHDPTGWPAGKNDFQTQGLAYSLDNGRTWEKYYINPVLKNPGIIDFRDPKVFWFESDNKWIMSLAVKDHIRFYSSPNLIDWTLESDFGKTYGSHGGVWECPDLFPLEIDGEKKWVLLVSINPGGPNGGSATQYFIGDFDGNAFTTDQAESDTLWLDMGMDNYAGVTWANIPESDGRILFMGWMSNWLYGQEVPTYKWRSAMTLPRELKLVKRNNEYKLASSPVEEINNQYDNTDLLDDQTIDNNSIIKSIELPTEINLNFSFDTTTPPERFGLKMKNDVDEYIEVGYIPSSKEYYIDRTSSGKMDFSDKFAETHKTKGTASDKTVQLKLIFDVASVEMFAENGEIAMTDIFFPNKDFSVMEIFTEGASIQMNNSNIIKLVPLN